MIPNVVLGLNTYHRVTLYSYHNYVKKNYSKQILLALIKTKNESRYS